MEKRRRGLELYLRAVVANIHIYNSPFVSGFFRLLEPLSPADQAALSPAPPASSPQVVTPGGPGGLSPAFALASSPQVANAIFQLPRPPARRLPDIVVLPPNQEECFAASMMDIVKQTLVMLSQLHAVRSCLLRAANPRL